MHLDTQGIWPHTSCAKQGVGVLTGAYVTLCFNSFLPLYTQTTHTAQAKVCVSRVEDTYTPTHTHTHTHKHTHTHIHARTHTHTTGKRIVDHAEDTYAHTNTHTH